VLRRERDQSAVLASLEASLMQLVGDAIVQGRLYERVLGHVHDPDVKALAVPGLVLRYVTPELIRKVLAGPCKLGDVDGDRANTIFEKLGDEVALVVQGDRHQSLELRPELRRIVLDDLAVDVASEPQQRAIREAAVEFFAGDPEHRAEELYHRLWLDHDPAIIDARWVRGIEGSLRSALDERLPERARTFLSNRLGVVQDSAAMASAPLIEWELWAEKRALDLLALGAPERALAVLAARGERSPASRLFRVESIAHRALPTPDLDGAEAASLGAIVAARATGDSSQLRDALEERVLVCRLRDDTPELLRTLADLGNLGDALGDDLVVLQAAVEGLESVGPARGTLSETAIRVFSRLPDELIARAPELARRVAAQVGSSDPETLQRVIRLVGVGPIDEAATASLASLLSHWVARDASIASFVPATAGARELSSATQYLATSRALAGDTARELSDWLGTAIAGRRARVEAGEAVAAE
jgi:hypothetical protein